MARGRKIGERTDSSLLEDDFLVDRDERHEKLRREEAREAAKVMSGIAIEKKDSVDPLDPCGLAAVLDALFGEDRQLLVEPSDDLSDSTE
jgi:hypothetical protein